MIFSSSYLSTDSSTATTSSTVNMLKSLNSVHLPPPPHASGLRPAAVLDPKALKRSVSSIGFAQKRQSTYSSFSASTTPKQQFAQVRSISLGTPASNSKVFVNTLSASSPRLSHDSPHMRLRKSMDQSIMLPASLDASPSLPSVPMKAVQSEPLPLPLPVYQHHGNLLSVFTAQSKSMINGSNATMLANAYYNPQYDPKLAALTNAAELSYLPNNMNNGQIKSTPSNEDKLFQMRNTLSAYFMPPSSLGLLGASNNNGNEIPEPKDMPPIIDDGTKPPYSYATLIGMAILRSDDRKLTLSQIYKWINETFIWYQTKSGWQNSIRHNLSLNKAFRKQERPKNDPGKGHYWIVEPGCEFQFVRVRMTKRQQPPSSFLSMNRAIQPQKPQQKMPPTGKVSTSTGSKGFKRKVVDKKAQQLSNTPVITKSSTLHRLPSTLSTPSFSSNLEENMVTRGQLSETKDHGKENEANGNDSAPKLKSIKIEDLDPKLVQELNQNTLCMSSVSHKRHLDETDISEGISSSSSSSEHSPTNNSPKKIRKKGPPASIQVQSIPMLSQRFLYDSSLSQNSPNKLWFTNVNDHMDTAQVIYDNSIVIKSPIRNTFDSELMLGKGLVVNGSAARATTKDHGLSIMTHTQSSSGTGTEDPTLGIYKSLGSNFSPVAFEFEDIYPYSPFKLSPQRLRFGIYQDDDLVSRTGYESMSTLTDRRSNFYNYCEVVEEPVVEPTAEKQGVKQ